MKPTTKKVSPLDRLQGMPAQAVPVVQVTPRGQTLSPQPSIINATVETNPPKKRWWHSVGTSSRYSSHVFLGSGLVFMERLERVAEPVVFLWKNFSVLLRAICYLAIPATSSALLLWLMPTLAKHVNHLSWFSVAYLAGFYIANAFGLLMLGFMSRALFKGFRSNLDSLAERGREAFSQPEEAPKPQQPLIPEGIKPNPFSPHHLHR